MPNLICKQAYGSHRWYAVHFDGRVGDKLSDVDTHPIRAIAFDSGVREVSGRSTDGAVKFFRTKRALLAAMGIQP